MTTPEKKGKAIENPKGNVTEGEATKFLKLIRHSEYELLDQMNKTLARVSLLSLLINSEGHRNLLFKVLNEAHVAQDITMEKFRGIINNITSSSHLSISEDEVSTEGRGHNQPLHIVVKCRNYMLARVLINNGSSLNSLEIVGTIGDELEQEGSKPSRASIMVPGKGLGRVLEGIVEPVAIQENPRRAGLGYEGIDVEGRTDRRTRSQRRIRPDLYQYFVSGGIILPEQVAMIGEPPTQIDNVTLVCDDANKSGKQDKGEEVEALIEIERMIEQENPKFQSLA
ncbi:hypothetical protein CR513_03794, partial [Mucuna pruriens]